MVCQSPRVARPTLGTGLPGSLSCHWFRHGQGAGSLYVRRFSQGALQSAFGCFGRCRLLPERKLSRRSIVYSSGAERSFHLTDLFVLEREARCFGKPYARHRRNRLASRHEENHPKAKFESGTVRIVAKSVSGHVDQRIHSRRSISGHVRQSAKVCGVIPQRLVYAARQDWGYRTAEVTMGGVSTSALSSKAMGVKSVPGLFFVGEVVDVTGHLGGYNFQWAWSSGYVAGCAA